MGRLGLRRARRAVAGGRRWVVALAAACAVGAWALAAGGPAARLAAGQPVASGPPGASLPGKAVYEKHCATCHGPTGAADGPGAAALPIKPPPLTDGRLLNPLTDDFLATIVRDGAAAVGLAPQMPGFGRLLTEREIRDVVAYVRTLAQPPYQPRAASPVHPIAPAPVQPIEFSHAVHAGSYGIDCQYCHADARRGIYAGLPSVARCMGCHKIVAAQGNPEVQKIHEYWNQKQAIPWVRIHKLAGFAYFPHKRHVQVGLACQTCHGPVETMQRVAQVAPLTMGWCVSCHAERRGPLDCVVCHH
ncbi:MAG TPA: c-type cytochrome [Gemmatimonadales bacterium]|nr:c-type cytochrome [Gemmatimonadales bacterium]